MTSYTVCKLLMLMHENVKTRTNRIAPYTTHTFWKTPVKSAPTPQKNQLSWHFYAWTSEISRLSFIISETDKEYPPQS